MAHGRRKYRWRWVTTRFKIGDGFDGHIANITYYDLESSPLLQFADGTHAKQLTLDAAGQAGLSVQATGEFSYLTSSNPLARMKVGIVANDSISGINLISTSEYQQLASLSYDVLGAVQSFDRFKELYVGSGNYGTEQTLAERLLAFVMDHTRTDIHLDGYKELTALKGVLSLLRRIPEARVLVPHVQTLIDYFNSQGETGTGATLTYAAADEIYKRLQPALRGQRVDLEEITLPLLVLAEMISAVPTAADRLASSIVSAEDFKTWMRFLSLPAEGWVGYEPPVPPLNSQCGDSADYQIMTSTPELSLPVLPCRMTGVRAGTLINGFFNDSPALATNPEMLPPVLYEFLDHLPYADIYIRKYLFSAPQLQLSWLDDLGLVKEAQAAFPAIIVGVVIRYAIQRAARKGVKKAVKNLVTFMLGKSNSRIQPLLLLASIGYLESRITGEGCGAAGENCVRIKGEENGDIAKAIRSLEKKLLLNILFRGRVSDEGINARGELICGFTYDTHGAAFELFMTAFFHLLHEQRGLPEYEILALQKRNEVVPISLEKGKLFSQAPSPDTAKKYATFIRNTDIVLKGDTDKPWYIEVKSYPAHDKRYPNHNDDVTKGNINAKFPLWKRGGKRRTTVHRQLIMDAILTQDNFADTGIRATEKQAADFRWYFQDWQPSRQQSNLRLRHPGNSVTRIKVAGEGGKTAFQYIREERLSRLAHEKDAASQQFVAWNLGRPTDLSLPANRTMYHYVIGAGDGGLKKRVKKFSLLSILAGETGDDIDPIIDRDGVLQILKDGLGMDARLADMIENPENYEDRVIEHLNQLGAGLARELEKLTRLESEGIKATYEEVLRHYQQLGQETGRLEEQIDKALEEVLEAIPNSGADQCF